MKKILTVFFYLCLFSVNFALFGQDSIAGIYGQLSYNNLILMPNGIFEFRDYSIESLPFYGTWNRVNDTTVYCKTDGKTFVSELLTIKDHSYYINDFTCIQRKDNKHERISIYLNYYSLFDTLQIKAAYTKFVYLYNNGTIKSEKRHSDRKTLITHYYPNGKIDEIAVYKYDFDYLMTSLVRYLKYDLNGKLLTHFYRKKDLRKLKCFYLKNGVYYNKDSPKSNDKNLKKITTSYYPDGKTDEVIEYKKGIQDEFYLKYDLDGRLITYKYYSKKSTKCVTSTFFNSDLSFSGRYDFR